MRAIATKYAFTVEKGGSAEAAFWGVQNPMADLVADRKAPLRAVPSFQSIKMTLVQEDKALLWKQLAKYITVLALLNRLPAKVEV